ncbi:MAG: hypothetical protein HGB37_01530 [Candidatus Moranbacteria bacterium]|nr:hypothetical protein [Candidatus Moranbacteria bacterium]
MTYAEFKTVIKNYVADSSADVTIAAADAIRHLSNFFWLDDEDTSLTGNGSTAIFSKPSGTIGIYGILVGDEEYEEIALDERERIDVCRDGGQNRFYQTATEIIFLLAPGSGKTITIHRRVAFTVPTADGTTLDIPERYLPVAALLGVSRYLRRLVLLTATTKQFMPDVDVNEIRRVLKEVSDEVDQEIKRIKQANV